MKIAIITANTEEYKEKKESAAAAAIQRIVKQVGFQVVFNATLPEDQTMLETVMNRLIDGKLVDVIVTTGSTGVTKKDCVPEATLNVIEKQIPGIPEAIRAYNIRYSKRTILDRSVAGVKNETLVVNLPDTPKLVQESLEYVLPELVHVVDMMK